MPLSLFHLTLFTTNNRYEKSNFSDNVCYFHGREIRKVNWAEGGRGFVFLLSLANGDDPEGWVKDEVDTYDGWGSDRGRKWRTGEQMEAEGSAGFKTKYGENSFGLSHRCYLRYDAGNRFWVSAEDGCEGTPRQPTIQERVNGFLGM